MPSNKFDPPPIICEALARGAVTFRDQHAGNTVRRRSAPAWVERALAAVPRPPAYLMSPPHPALDPANTLLNGDTK